MAGMTEEALTMIENKINQRTERGWRLKKHHAMFHAETTVLPLVLLPPQL